MREERNFAGISEKVRESAERMIAMAEEGSVKQHLLGDTSQTRYRTMEDKSMDVYCNFLQTKLCYEVMRLEGEKCHV